MLGTGYSVCLGWSCRYSICFLQWKLYETDSAPLHDCFEWCFETHICARLHIVCLDIIFCALILLFSFLLLNFSIRILVLSRGLFFLFVFYWHKVPVKRSSCNTLSELLGSQFGKARVILQKPPALELPANSDKMVTEMGEMAGGLNSSRTVSEYCISTWS